MISKYFATLVVFVALVSMVASTWQFASRSQVLSGNGVDETFKLDFTFDADSTHTYEVNPALKARLEEQIAFQTEGPVRVASSSVEITPKDVSWTENRTTYTSPGAGLVAHVKWDTPGDSANGNHGNLYIQFPEVPGLGSKAPTFHTGGYQKDDQGRFVLREVTTYRSGILLNLARFSFALVAGLPVGILLHSMFWAFVLRKEKKTRLAALPQQGSQLPRTFYPDPILEWFAWTLSVGIASFSASMMAVIAVSDGFISSSMAWVVYIMMSIGVTIGLVAAYFARRRALTVRVESHGIAYAHGRGDLQWLNASWSDILVLTEKSRTYRGSTRYWMEVEFKDNRKKLRLTQVLEGYPALKQLLFSVLKS